MRITQKTMSQNFMVNLRKNLEKMQLSQAQLSSGQEISRPSDDPYRVIRSLDIRNSVRINEQFSRNIEDSKGWVDANDASLSSLTDSLNRVRELVIRGANTKLDEQAYNAIHAEIDQLSQGIGDVLNANYDGRYIFGGSKTTEPPIPKDWVLANPEPRYNGDDGPLKREIIQGVELTINITGSDIMNEGEEPSLGDTLKGILEALENSGSGAADLGGKYLKDIDGHMENVLALRNKNGAVHNRLNMLSERNKTESLEMEGLLSKVEDIDFAEKVTEFLMLESVYRASLSVGAKVMQPSLLDYI